MTKKAVPVEAAAEKWMQDREFRDLDNALEEEFALAQALIEARAKANMTQSDRR